MCYNKMYNFQEEKCKYKYKKVQKWINCIKNTKK